jgi:Uma2 family endonuclease
MVQSKLRFAAFEDYLAYDKDLGLEARHELIDGKLIELPSETELNTAIAHLLLALLMRSGVRLRLIKLYQCEIQVPILRPGDPANRFPDLVVLRPEHLPLTQQRLTLTLGMAPPQLVVEVVSPGQENRARDYIHKRAQYAAREIPEYWIIDPELQVVVVLVLQGDCYQEVGTFQGNTLMTSSAFPELKLTPVQILHVE